MTQQALEKYLWGAITALRATIDKVYMCQLKQVSTANPLAEEKFKTLLNQYIN